MKKQNMIAVIDYKMGNLQSVSKGIQKAGADVTITSSKDNLAKAKGIVLPGVGAFEKGIKNLEELDIIGTLKERLAQGVPFLGICLGMQLLFSQSEENGFHKGLEIIPGKVIRFSPDVKIPHMGWNDITITKESRLFSGIGNDTYFYFVHSYYCIPDNNDDILCTTEYSIPFTSAIARGNIFGTQFHPEKSQYRGIRILENFIKIVNK